jgi:hypothetical protein
MLENIMIDDFNAGFDKPTPKYVLHPGYVTSKNDGDRHFIDAKKLARLYSVPMCECVVQPDISDPRNKYWHPPEDAIHLRPSYEGNYAVHNATVSSPRIDWT